VIAGAAFLDLLLGDPPALPHPVAAIARIAHVMERFARTRVRNELAGGSLVLLAVLTVTATAGALLERAPLVARTIAAASMLAAGSLLDHADAVFRALERGDLPAARAALARFVGRDTATLDEGGVARGAIEALAESTCDGIVAPLLFLACFGLRGVFAYKAINTLDSIVGHIEAPYTYFGRASARCDDLVNFVPARVSGTLLALAAACTGADARSAFALMRRDGRKHRSPNAGMTEAAMAGALGVRLGGTLVYDGVAHDAAVIGAELRPPRYADVRRAMSITFGATFLACVLAASIETCRR